MADYRVLIKPSAFKDLAKLPKKIVRQLVKRIENLAKDPRPFGVEKLSGQDRYRIRQGSHRVVYSIDDHTRTVEVVKISHRREAYR